MTWFNVWLFLHILQALVAFGPTFVYPLIGAHTRKHPEHALAMASIGEQIEKKLVLPVAVLVPLFGTALIFTAHVNLWKSEWLIIAIVLYTIAFLFALLVQDRNATAMLKAVGAMPPGPPPAGATGPPPHIAALAKKLQFGGMFLTVLVLVILGLMIFKPGNCQGVC